MTPRLHADRRQFWLLVAVNACVGGVVGLERTVLPLLAETEFGLTSQAAVLSFIAMFGLAKAGTNWIAGELADRYGRRRVLLAGWVLAIPVPVLLIVAPSWTWVVASNFLLGVSQGLTWSMTVVMKIDLVGPARRGLAVGLNELAGYVAVGLAALASGLIAERFGLWPEPFYLGIVFVAIGLGLTIVWVRDTDAGPEPPVGADNGNGGHRGAAWAAFARTSWGDRSLMSCSQAGLMTNLNDGIAWGLLPLMFASGGVNVGRIGVLAAVYPVTWGLLQFATGALSDRWGRKPFIVSGMLVQSSALMLLARAETFEAWLPSMALLGVGTALVYPTLLAAVSDRAGRARRASMLGTYRFWRDLGYVVGALGIWLVAGRWSAGTIIMWVAVLTAGSGLVSVIFLSRKDQVPGTTESRRET